MRLPKEVVSAVNTYFAFKNNTRTGFFESVAVKELCLRAVDRAAGKFGIGFSAAPGLLVFSRGGKTYSVTAPILPPEAT